MSDIKTVNYIEYIVNGGDFSKLPKPGTQIEAAMYALCQMQENGGMVRLRKGSTNVEYSNDGGRSWHALVAIADLKGQKGDTGAAGAAGPAGPAGARGPAGTAGSAGAAGVGVKSIALTKDANGAITGGTWVDTANASHTITITTATA